MAGLLESVAALGPKAATYSRWLAARAGGVVADSPAAVKRFAGMGAGLCAARPVRAGSTVLRVPPELWTPVSSQMARQAATAKAPGFVAGLSRVAASWGDEDGRFDTTVLLALHSLMELGSPSPNLDLAPGKGAFPYFNYVASVAPPDVPAFWPPDRLNVLQGSRTGRMSVNQRNFYAAAHEAVFPGGGMVSVAQWEWALRTILSRAVSGSTSPYTFVPLLDFLNHSAQPGVKHVYDDSDGCFVVTALRDHEPGEQLFTSYGDGLGNDVLLRLYGFAVAGNEHTVADIPGPGGFATSLAAAEQAATLLLARERVQAYRGTPPDTADAVAGPICPDTEPAAKQAARRAVADALRQLDGSAEPPEQAEWVLWCALALESERKALERTAEVLDAM